MLVSEFLRHLGSVIPLAAVGYDRDAVGLQVGLPAQTKLVNALFAYEVTAEVIDEAVRKECNLIVAFHPLIFPNVASVTEETRTGAILTKLIRADIALYVVHTAFDTLPAVGTSHQMARVLGCDRVEVLAPLLSFNPRPVVQTDTPWGMGVLGVWNVPKTTTEVLALTQDAFSTTVLRHSAIVRDSIRRVAMVGGAGMEFYGAACRAGVDAFITADVRYHDFYRAEHDGILLIDAGHSETERFVANAMRDVVAQLLVERESGWANRLIASETRPNAVRYHARA